MMPPRMFPGTCFMEGVMSESETAELVKNLRRARRRSKAIAIGQMLFLVILFFYLVPRGESQADAFWRGLGEQQKLTIARQAAMEQTAAAHNLDELKAHK